MRALYDRLIEYLQRWILIQHWEIILLVALFILFFMVTRSFAGVDFTGKAMVVPHFGSIQQAVNFAIEVKWNDDVLEELKKRRSLNFEYAYHKTKGWLLAGQKQDGNMYRDQWLWNDTAAEIIERFKKRGERAVGAAMYAGSYPVERGTK